MKLWQRGIDFYARGNEPFLSLDMDFEGQFLFDAIGVDEIKIASVDGVKAQDANVTRYFSEVAAGTIIITIMEDTCRDSMSGELFRNSVRVQLKRTGEPDYTAYEGCGRFVTDFGLNDIWALQSINGIEIEKNTNIPSSVIEFSANENHVMGTTSCNSFNGSYFIAERGIIQFGDMAITKKLCQHMEIENIYSNSLFGRRLKYTRQHLLLKISGYDGQEFIFKKVD
ncbi:MAG: META domain-containing protein [Cyclobacteriaceae bacterium]|nr:META domain-containing protein [Cyclobacteriaceae bacterium]